MSTSVWTLTVDEDSVVTTVHLSEEAALESLRDNYCEGMDLPQDADEMVDFLTKPSWEGGPGVVFWIEEHILDAEPEPEPALVSSPSPEVAIAEIRRLALAHDLAVSIVSVPDVIMLKGVDGGSASVHRDAVVDSWEWRHYGDNWCDWFEGLTLEE